MNDGFCSYCNIWKGDALMFLPDNTYICKMCFDKEMEENGGRLRDV